jgi:hypothetical protein
MPENSIAHRHLEPEGAIEAGVTFRVTAECRFVVDDGGIFDQKAAVHRPQGLDVRLRDLIDCLRNHRSNSGLHKRTWITSHVSSYRPPSCERLIILIQKI